MSSLLHVFPQISTFSLPHSMAQWYCLILEDSSENIASLSYYKIFPTYILLNILPLLKTHLMSAKLGDFALTVLTFLQIVLCLALSCHPRFKFKKQLYPWWACLDQITYHIITDLCSFFPYSSPHLQNILLLCSLPSILPFLLTSYHFCPGLLK